MSDRGLTNQWEPWQRLIDSIGPYYRDRLFEGDRLFEARDRANAKLDDLDEEELASLASEGRKIASWLDEDDARLTVSLHDERDRYTRRADELRAEAGRLRRQARRAISPRRRREVRKNAAERAARADQQWQLANEAHEQLRELGNSGRHLYPWFEQHEEVLGRGLAAEFALKAASGAAYHVLGAPCIASLTAACLTTDRAIDLGRLERLVKQDGEARQRLLFEVAAELYGREQGVSLTEMLAELDGEDLDRVLYAIAVLKRRQSASLGSHDLWIRAAEPE